MLASIKAAHRHRGSQAAVHDPFSKGSVSMWLSMWVHVESKSADEPREQVELEEPVSEMKSEQANEFEDEAELIRCSVGVRQPKVIYTSNELGKPIYRAVKYYVMNRDCSWNKTSTETDSVSFSVQKKGSYVIKTWNKWKKQRLRSVQIKENNTRVHILRKEFIVRSGDGRQKPSVIEKRLQLVALIV